jgi:nucleotidyltransferase/DNA polymerase involved in DNA repair
MEEADYSMTNAALNNSASMSGDDQLLVRFYRDIKQNPAKTEAEGRPIYDDVDWIEIHQPGNKLTSLMRQATDKDKQRFPRHWQAYQARENQEELSGTPIEQWPGVTKAQVAELKHLNIRSIEQLVNLSDGNSTAIMGIAALKRNAKAYLEAADQQKAANEIQASKEKVELLEQQNARMASRLEALEELLGSRNEEPKRRGRPPKEVVYDERTA